MTVVVDRQQLRAFIQEKCNVSSVRNFQLDGATHIIEGRDLVLVIAPGSGKTLVLLAPLLWAQQHEELGIALIVVPSKFLTEQQVCLYLFCCRLMESDSDIPL